MLAKVFALFSSAIGLVLRPTLSNASPQLAFDFRG